MPRKPGNFRFFSLCYMRLDSLKCVVSIIAQLHKKVHHHLSATGNRVIPESLLLYRGFLMQTVDQAGDKCDVLHEFAVKGFSLGFFSSVRSTTRWVLFCRVPQGEITMKIQQTPKRSLQDILSKPALSQAALQRIPTKAESLPPLLP